MRLRYILLLLSVESQISNDSCVTAANVSVNTCGNATLYVMLLQICTPNICKQLQANVGLLTKALQAANAHIEVSADIEMVLAVSRGLEVLSRVQELLDGRD